VPVGLLDQANWDDAQRANLGGHRAEVPVLGATSAVRTDKNHLASELPGTLRDQFRRLAFEDLFRMLEPGDRDSLFSLAQNPVAT
jgi:hypothetical protein